MFNFPTFYERVEDIAQSLGMSINSLIGDSRPDKMLSPNKGVVAVSLTKFQNPKPQTSKVEPFLPSKKTSSSGSHSLTMTKRGQDVQI